MDPSVVTRSISSPASAWHHFVLLVLGLELEKTWKAHIHLNCLQDLYMTSKLVKRKVVRMG